MDLESAYARIDELEAEVEQLRKDALIDPLTRLLNRRAADRLLREARERFLRHQVKFSVIMFDLDHFKMINDCEGWGGHANGDRVLSTLGTLLLETLRTGDRGIRWGGEEFLVITENDQDGARVLAERLRRDIEATIPVSPNVNLAVTASFGVAEFVDIKKPAAKAVLQADQALYRAKRYGRNRVES
jgi:diguanylate cyclase